MAYVNGFQHDVFISYAHDDNAPDGWVSQFVKLLQCELNRRVGSTTKPNIYFDANSLHHQLNDLLDAAQNSAIFLAVASRCYANREWTQRELAAFYGTNPDLHRLFVAECLPLSEGTYPDPLEKHARKKFWKTHEPESLAPATLTAADSEFSRKIQDLAETISLQLKTLNNAPLGARASRPPSDQDGRGSSCGQDARAPRESGKCVLLAQVTDDLEEEREQVRRYLEQFHLSVLPENTYPQGGDDFKAAFAQDLVSADYFVQLLGSHPGKTPPDLPQGYSRLQWELARQSPVKILQWRHPLVKMDAIANPAYRELLSAETVMTCTLESFKAEIVKLSQTPKPQPAPPKSALSVFINADREDLTIAKTLQAELSSRYRLPVAVPIFEQQNLDENLIDCDILLWVYGQATRTWVQSQLRHFNKKKPQRTDHPHLLALCIGLPPDPPDPKPDIGMAYPDLQHVDCRANDFAELHALFAGLCR